MGDMLEDLRPERIDAARAAVLRELYDVAGSFAANMEQAAERERRVNALRAQAARLRRVALERLEQVVCDTVEKVRADGVTRYVWEAADELTIVRDASGASVRVTVAVSTARAEAPPFALVVDPAAAARLVQSAGTAGHPRGVTPRDS